MKGTDHGAEPPVPVRRISRKAGTHQISPAAAIAEVLSNSIEVSSTIPATGYSDGTYTIHDDGPGITPNKLASGGGWVYGASAVYGPGAYGLGVAGSSFVMNKMGFSLTSADVTLILTARRREGNHSTAEFDVLPGIEMTGTRAVITNCREADVREAELQFLALKKHGVRRAANGIRELEMRERGIVFVNGRLARTLDGLAFSYDLEADKERTGDTVKAILDTTPDQFRSMVRQRLGGAPPDGDP